MVAVGLAWRGVAGGDGCPGSDHYLQPDTREAVEKAQVVLYGRDITPKQSCSSPPELCPRRQIHFEVDYVLKNVIGRTIPARITIGRDGEQIDVRCHGTYFSHDSRQQLVVMVRWSNGLWLWDEIVPKFNAAFTGSPELLDWFAGVCGIGPIHAPSGGSPNHCSRLRKPMNKECQTGKDLIKCFFCILNLIQIIFLFHVYITWCSLYSQNHILTYRLSRVTYVYDVILK